MQNDNKASNESSAPGISWTLVIVLVVIGAVLFISRQDSSPISDKEARQMANDVNYCRSLGAQYGQQGAQGFSQAYNSCMSGKGY